MGSLTNPDDPQAAQARDEAEQVNMLLAFWLGGLVYGTLFVPFLRLRELEVAILDRGLRHPVPEIREVGSKDTRATWLTLCKGILSSDVSHACHHDSVHGPSWTRASNGLLPVYYLRNYATFHSFAPSVMMAVQVWLGDALVVIRLSVHVSLNYRAQFIVSRYIGALSSGSTIVNNSILLASLMHPKALTFTQVRPVIDMVYPINITQSCLTTALITLKLWRQYRLSRSAGLTPHGSGVGLLTVMRIIVETTMIFTVQQVIMCALYYLDKPAQHVFHGTLVPSIGITFVLLSIRVNEARETMKLDIRIPQTSSGSPTSPVTPSSNASEGIRSGLNPMRRNRRRTVSESFALTSPSGSLAGQDFFPMVCRDGSAPGEPVDVEMGSSQRSSSTPDAILALKHRHGAPG
ncbi:hypothetical protein NMY22_g2380 [Coprinellus aureogranulatus]|nr:hypothetical protein NMY22_g2380 [Coprinellus aureogranulatus]